MWLLEYLLFMSTVTSLAAIFAPWAVLLKEFDVEGLCTLPDGYQFRQWATVCGYSWEGLNAMKMNMYFALVTGMLLTRRFSLASAILAQLNMGAIFCEVPDGILTLLSLGIVIVTTLSLSEYKAEMDSTMLIPNDFFLVQGAGYLLQILTIVYNGAFVAIVLCMQMFKDEISNASATESKNGGGSGSNSFIANLLRFTSDMPAAATGSKCLLYMSTMLSLIAMLGDVAHLSDCLDDVTPFSLGTCKANSVIRTVAACFLVANFLMCMHLYLIFAFVNDRRNLYLFLMSCLLLCVGMSLVALGASAGMSSAASAGYAIYAIIGHVVCCVINICLMSQQREGLI